MVAAGAFRRRRWRSVVVETRLIASLLGFHAFNGRQAIPRPKRSGVKRTTQRGRGERHLSEDAAGSEFACRLARARRLPPVPRAVASLAAGVGSDAGADAAQRVDGHAEEVGHIAQLDAVGKAGEAGEEHAVALGGRQLEAVGVLVQHAAPVGNVDVGGIQPVEPRRRDGIEGAVLERLDALDGPCVVVERVHAECHVALDAEPRGRRPPVVVEDRPRDAPLDEVCLAAHRARADYLGAVRHVHAAHRGGQRGQCLVAHGPRRADRPHDVGYVGDVSHAFNAWGGAKVKK